MALDTWRGWLRSLKTRNSKCVRMARPTGRHASLRLEPLEDRCLPTTFSVANTNDGGAGSLSQAILDANANAGLDRIEFNLPANDSRHLYYRNDGVAGHVTLAKAATTTATDDMAIADIDPDWAHSWWSILVSSPSGTTTPVVPLITDPVVIDGYTQGWADPLHPTPQAASPNTAVGADNAVLRIELNGSGIAGGQGFHASGLEITAGQSTVRGLVVNNFVAGGNAYAYGVVLHDKGGDVVAGNFIGTDPSGTVAQTNGALGLYTTGCDGNTLGGTVPGDRNLISGNHGDNLRITDSSNNVVQGNFIGPDASGTKALSQGSDNNGITITGGNAYDLFNGPANGNLIGGSAAGAGNVISGNSLVGISLAGFFGTVSGTAIQGNFIGTNATGTGLLGNGTEGISLSAFVHSGYPIGDVIDNTIGGTTPAARNIVSGNGLDGGAGISIGVGGPVSVCQNNLVEGNYIGTDVTGTVALGNRGDGVAVAGGNNNFVGNVISGNGDGIDIRSSGVTVQGNFIGTAADGVTALGNTGEGISIGSSPNNLVGGTNSGEGNVIAFNSGFGVLIANSPGTSALGNSIFANGKIGINLSGGAEDAYSVTSNDIGEADNVQNFPVITSVSSAGGNTTISGTLSSTPNSTFRVEFFASAAVDASSFGEGQRFLGAISTNASDRSGNVSFSATLPGVTVGSTEFVSATATALVAGNPTATSEFSEINADLVLNQVAPQTGSIGQNLTYTLTVTNQGPFPAANVALTDVLPAGVTFVSAQFTHGVGIATQNNGTVAATLTGVLALGDSAIVAIVVTPTAAGSISNQAIVAAQVLNSQNQVIAHENDPNPTNNSTSADTRISAVVSGQVTVSGMPVTGFERTAFSGDVATLADTLPGVTTADFNIMINWGDGQSTHGSAVAAGSGFTVQGTHTYLDEGHFPVTIQVTDTANSTGTATSPLTMLEELLPGGVRGTANQRYVSELYRDMLRRAVEPAGLAFWSGLLEHGTSRIEVAFQITQSEEYRRGVVQDLYQQYLHRAADATGLHAWVAFLAGGGSQEALAALIVSSPEYNQTQAHGTDAGFLDVVFHDGLNRSIDEAGRHEFMAQLIGGRSRQAVAEQIFASTESQLDLVKSIYLRYLDRALDASGKATWTHFQMLGASDDRLLAHILGEPVGHEFFDKTLP